jgi:hypothetical protein
MDRYKKTRYLIIKQSCPTFIWGSFRHGVQDKNIILITDACIYQGGADATLFLFHKQFIQ